MVEARLDDGREGAHPATEPDDPGARAAHDRRRSDHARVVEVVGLLGGTVLVVVLFWQYLGVYLTFYGDPVTVTPADGTRYLVTAIACVTLLLAGTGAAVVGEHRWVTALGFAILTVGLASAFVLAVPQDRWAVDQVPQAPGPEYHPCRSGGDSDECLGG